MGEQKRNLAQSSLDEAYLKYVEQQQFPEQQLARYQSSIYGNPLLKQPSYSTTGTQTAGSPGLGKTLLGLGTTALGFGTGGGNTIGGSLFNKITRSGGGGIGSTMKAQEYMNRNMGGQVMPPIVYQQEGSFGNKIINQLPGFLQDILRSGQPNYRTDDGEASDIAYGTVPLENVKPTLKRQFSPFQKDQLETKERPSIKSPKVVDNRIPLTAAERFGIMSELGTDDTQAPVPRLLLGENPENLDGDDTQAPNNLNLSSPLSKILQGIRNEDGNLSLDLINKKYLELTGEKPPVQSDVPKTVKKNEPVKVDTSRKYPKNPDLADNEPGSNKESLTRMSQARAVNTEKQVVSDIAKQVQEQSGNDGITTLRKALETYNKDIRSFIDKDPYRQQKFWLTVSAAIMQPGNAFANMAKGFKQAIDGLDASDKKKNELLMGLLGKKFDTEVAVSGIQEKRSSSLKDRIKDLNIAISKASGEARKELIKQKAKILAADRLRNSKRSTKLLESEDAEIYDLVKATYSGLSKSKRNRLDKQLDKFGGGDKAWYQTGNNKKDIADWVRNQINRGKNFNEIIGLI